MSGTSEEANLDEMFEFSGSDLHYAGSIYLKSYWANIIVFGACALAVLWALYQVYWINSIDMKVDVIKVQQLVDEDKEALESEGK